MTVQLRKRKAEAANLTPENPVVKRQKVDEESPETREKATQTVAQAVFAQVPFGCAASPNLCMPALTSPPFPPRQTSIQDLWNSFLSGARSSADQTKSLMLKILNHPDYGTSSEELKMSLFWRLDTIRTQTDILELLGKFLSDWPSILLDNKNVTDKLTNHLIAVWNTCCTGDEETQRKTRQIFEEILLPAVPDEDLILLYRKSKKEGSSRLDLFMLNISAIFNRTPTNLFEELIWNSLDTGAGIFKKILKNKPIPIETLQKIFLKLCEGLNRRHSFRYYMLTNLPQLFTKDFVDEVMEKFPREERYIGWFFREIGVDTEKLPEPFLRFLLEVFYIKTPPDGTKTNKEMYRSWIPLKAQMDHLLKRKAPELKKPLLEIAHTLNHPAGRAMIEPELLPFLEEASKKEAMGLFALGTLPATSPGTTPLRRLFENRLFERRLLRCIGEYLWTPKNTSTGSPT